MRGKVLHVRLTAVEWKMLAEVSDSREGSLNPSEKIRQMLYREHSRRKTGRSTFSNASISSQARTGRPKVE